MSLECMDLLYLATIRKTDVVDAKEVLGVVFVNANFAPETRNDTKIFEDRGGIALSHRGARKRENQCRAHIANAQVYGSSVEMSWLEIECLQDRAAMI